MHFLLKNRLLLTVVCAILLILLGVAIHEGRRVDIAHSTFENYYSFRGCVQLIHRTDSMGNCKTTDGQTLKIVRFQNKWYLDGDLPICWHGFCI